MQDIEWTKTDAGCDRVHNTRSTYPISVTIYPAGGEDKRRYPTAEYELQGGSGELNGLFASYEEAVEYAECLVSNEVGTLPETDLRETVQPVD